MKIETLHDLFQLYVERGANDYFGEYVTQLDHAEQCAALAAAEGVGDALVVAAFLHDVGHLLVPAYDEHVDDRHEHSGAALVRRLLGDAVAEPIRLHVQAKRYLCSADPDYVAGLSPASIASLAVQGGPLDEEERTEFEADPWALDAVSLRRWDDLGKASDAARMPLAEVARRAQALATVGQNG